MASRGLAYVAIATGTVTSVVGGAQLASAWMATDLPRADRMRVGTVSALLLATGTLLEIAGAHELHKLAEAEDDDAEAEELAD